MNARNKMEGPMFKKTKEPSKRVKGEHQVFQPLLVARSISYKERGGPLERTPNLRKTFTYCNNTSQNRYRLRMLKCH
jgi:hypothetical protein